MAVLTVQNLGANGAASAITFAAASAGGDEFDNNGKVLLAVQWGTTPGGNVQIEGVPAADSGRDGTVTVTSGAVNSVSMAGPFKPRNFNTNGRVQITYPGTETDINVAAIRYTTG